MNDLSGAIEALPNDDAQYFMWEHFTTKPLVDNGTFRRVADCPTPWPCFVIAVKNEILKIQIVSKIFKIFKNILEFQNIQKYPARNHLRNYTRNHKVFPVLREIPAEMLS